MTNSVDQLLALLNLQPATGDNRDNSGGDNRGGTGGRFIGPASNEPHVRAFGGQVLAQALMAAGHTAAGRVPNSLHAYFVRPGRTNLPITYCVETLRTGRSFSIRSVEAIQDGEVLLHLLASFHADEPGIEHQPAMPEVPAPELLATFHERFGGRTDMDRWFTRSQPFDIRYVDHTPFEPARPGHPPAQQLWVTTVAPLPDNPLLHCAVVAYLSDLTVLDAILLTHGMRWTDRAVMGASLDHAMWFHQPFRADRWLLFDQNSPVTHGARGFARAQLWTHDGLLAASVAQEALLRPPYTGVAAP